MLAPVDEATLQRVGSALRRMGEDLVAERRRVMILTRENEALRAQLEELKRAVAAADPSRATAIATTDAEAQP